MSRSLGKIKVIKNLRLITKSLIRQDANPIVLGFIKYLTLQHLVIPLT